MRLHHVTNRKNCCSIAETGSKVSKAVGMPVIGVFLAPPGALWLNDGFETLDDMESLSPESVVFAFDIPDEVARQYSSYECPVEPDDTSSASWQDSGVLPDNPEAAGWTLYEYIVPSDIANRYCSGLVHWSGKCPLSAEQIAKMRSRCA